jgi:hypothetical protein
MAASAKRVGRPENSGPRGGLPLRATLAAALFAAAVPSQALAAGPGLGASFGLLGVAGVVLIVGGLLFLVWPELIGRLPGASAPTDAGEEPASTSETAAPPPEPVRPPAAEQASPPPSEPVTSPAAEKAPPPPPKAPAPVDERPAAGDTPGTGAARPPIGKVYTPETCTEYAGGLGDRVLGRAKIFFASLASEGEIDSTRLAERLGAAPTGLAGLLLTPLTRRAEAINAPAPFGLGRVKGTRRRLWLDEDGVAARLDRAIEREIASRSGVGARPNGGGRAADRDALAEGLASMKATGT